MDIEARGSRVRGYARGAAVYGLTTAFVCITFLLIRMYGEHWWAPAAAAEALRFQNPRSQTNVFLHVLIALMAIIVTGQVLSRILVYLHQPPVISEVLAGILLGPSLIGSDASAMVMPPAIAPVLNGLAQLGVVLYMFLVGVELNPALLRQRTAATVAISHASIAFPFLLASLLALFLYPRLSNSLVDFTTFALFLGVAMSITAFPVLARILNDFRLTRTALGVVALSCAAVDDVTAWCLLAFVVGVAQTDIGYSLNVIIGALVFVGFMLLAVGPLLRRLTRSSRDEEPARLVITLTIVAVLLSAITAEAIGIHAIFGAFLAGAVIPHDGVAARTLKSRLESIVGVVLLPAFFAYTGLRTRIDLLSGLSDWLICGLLIVVATTGKFGGSLIAARLTGLTWRDSAILGALMNTRGLVELIALNIGLDLGIISPTLFSMLVVMALVTTGLTAPTLHLLMIKESSGLMQPTIPHQTGSTSAR